MRKKHLFASLLPAAVVLACAALVAGCAGTKAAYSEAQTLDEYAYVLTEHYASLVREAADLREKSTTPREAIEAMRRADNAVHLIVVGNPSADPPVPGLAELADTYKRIRDAQSEAELQDAVNRAILKIADLVRAIKAARGSPSTRLNDIYVERLSERLQA